MSLFIELPNYVDKEFIKEIRESVKPFIPKTKHHTYNRDGYTVNISKNPELKLLDNKINNIFTNLQAEVVFHRYRPKFLSGSSSFEYHLYEAGDICNVHSDNEINFEKNSSSSLIRYASVILHLNTVEEGGELIFPNQNKSIKTEEGKIVVFPPYSMFTHYTTPAKVNREIIVTWFVYSGVNATKV
jgi:hypothetical protein